MPDDIPDDPRDMVDPSLRMRLVRWFSAVLGLLLSLAATSLLVWLVARRTATSRSRGVSRSIIESAWVLGLAKPSRPVLLK